MKKFQKQFYRLKEYIERNAIKDDTYYLEMLQLYSKRYYFLESNINELQNDDGYIINNYLDKFYIANKLFLFQLFDSFEHSNRLNLEQMFNLSHCIEAEVVKLADLMENRNILRKYGLTFLDLKIIIECAI
ncbi:MAG: hypothetical protein IPL53_00230 [Ignavibacteria bacterium]|nr:hypothetical protein [Ignavibacteria bacterium]